MARKSILSSSDLRFYVVVASAASLAAASRALDVSRSAVTQRLSQLEARLRCRLLDRDTRRLKPTEEGQLLLARARALLEDLDELSDTLGFRRHVVSGHLRIAAPLGFGRRYVAPLAAAFQARNPAVTITLTLTESPVIAAEDNWELIIHIGELRDSSRVMVPLAPNQRIACASPAYLAARGEPTSPMDLASHACLALRENDEDATLWRFADPDGESLSVRIAPTMSSNDGETVHLWACEGRGIMVRSEWDVADDLRAGRLRRILTRHSLPCADVVALVGKRGGRTARANAFLEALRARMRPVPWRLPSAGGGS